MPRNHAFKKLAAFMTLVALSACSQESSKSNPQKKFDPLVADGKFFANLNPLNPGVAGMTSGKASVKIDRDSFEVSIDVKDSPSFTDHPQFIYFAEKCPSLDDDQNSDGFIDPVEAEKVLGKALIPLDGDVSAQEIGLAEFPFASGIGNYNYQKEASFSKFIADLRSPDLDPKDDLIKIGSRSNFNFHNKVVVIHGVPTDAYLPPTVDAGPGRSARAALAISCGKLAKVEEDNL